MSLESTARTSSLAPYDVIAQASARACPRLRRCLIVHNRNHLRLFAVTTCRPITPQKGSIAPRRRLESISTTPDGTSAAPQLPLAPCATAATAGAARPAAPADRAARPVPQAQQARIVALRSFVDASLESICDRPPTEWALGNLPEIWRAAEAQLGNTPCAGQPLPRSLQAALSHPFPENTLARSLSLETRLETGLKTGLET